MPEIKKKSSEAAEELEGRRPSKAAKSRAMDAMILNENTPFAVQEAYKSLRTNVIFALPDEGGKVIGVTSGTKGDGKSSTVLNLALAFAEIGKRCILIDCDLRLPTVAAKLGLSNIPGLTDVLVGDARPGDAIQHYHELDILAAGTIPRDSTGLLSSKRMASFVAKLRELYDYVFIDFPPVTTVTAAAILSASVDGYLLVVRHNVTEYKAIAAMIKLLRIADARILGIVYNDAPAESKKYYKSYSYYK